VAIGAVKLQLVTSGRWTVTAEVASSSLVVPAITFNHLRLWKNFRVGTKKYKFRAQLPYNNVYVQPIASL
jgi:hypothetical protein